MRAPIAIVSALVVAVHGVAGAQEAEEAPKPQQAEEPAEARETSKALEVPVAQKAHVEKRAPAGLGEKCGATADCSTDLRCARNVCAPNVQELSSPSEALQDARVHGYFGGALGAPLPMLWRSNIGEGFQGALRLGLLYHGVQFQLELAPGSTVMANIDKLVTGLFEGALTIGYLVPIGSVASWILRAGGGGGGVYGENAPVHGDISAFGEIRAEVFGVAIPTSRHLVIELGIPSYRLLFLPKGGGVEVGMTWVTNFALHYML